MIKQLVLPIIGVAVFIIAVGLFIQKSGSMKLPTSIIPAATVPPSAKVATVDGKSLNIEIANTKDLRTKGLSGRASLDANAGMLFVFEAQNVNPGFWMKDMLIPLDIIWINDGKIVQIDKNVQAPAPGTADNHLQVYTSKTAVDYVLEVNAGFANKNNIKVGDSVTLPSGL